MWFEFLMKSPQSWWRCSILCSSARYWRKPVCIHLTLSYTGMSSNKTHPQLKASFAPITECCRHMFFLSAHSDSRLREYPLYSKKLRCVLCFLRANDFPMCNIHQSCLSAHVLFADKDNRNLIQHTVILIYILFCARASTWIETGSWFLSSSKWINSVPATHSRWQTTN